MNETPPKDDDNKVIETSNNMTARSKVMQNWSSSWHDMPVPVMPNDDSVRQTTPKHKSSQSHKTNVNNSGKTVKKTKENSQLMNVKGSAKSNKSKTNKSLKSSNNESDHKSSSNDLKINNSDSKTDDNSSSDSLNIYKNLRKRKSSVSSQPKTTEVSNIKVCLKQPEIIIEKLIDVEKLESKDPIADIDDKPEEIAVISETDDKPEEMAIITESEDKQEEHIEVMADNDDKQEHNEISAETDNEMVVIANHEQRNEVDVDNDANVSISVENKTDTDIDHNNGEIDCNTTLDESENEKDANLVYDKLNCVICGKDVAKHALFQNRFCSSNCAIEQWTHEFKQKWSKDPQ